MSAAMACKAIAADYMSRLRARGFEAILIDDDHLAFEWNEDTPALSDLEWRTVRDLRAYLEMALYDKTVERRLEES